MGVIYFDFQGNFAILSQSSRKLHSTSILYTELDQIRGVAHPNVLVFFYFYPIFAAIFSQGGVQLTISLKWGKWWLGGFATINVQAIAWTMMAQFIDASLHHQASIC